MKDLTQIRIVIVGLGYVGLPLAVEFGKKYNTIGLDINQDRIAELQSGYDKTRELTKEQIEEAKQLSFTSNIEDVKNSESRHIFIITVPTPIDQYKKPDLRPLLSASKTVGKVLIQNDIVIYESTVYPGCTEEDCVPILEKESGLIFNTDFFCGYSPERINPGDKEHTVSKIKKITSGSTPEIADLVDNLYKSIIMAGTFKAASIKVAEAAKLVENCQRYVNISLINEFAQFFDIYNLNVKDVLDAANTKWNFHNYYPGLIGGPCLESAAIYFTHKSQIHGFDTKILLASIQRNEDLLNFLLLKLDEIKYKNTEIAGINITLTKPNCPSMINEKVNWLLNQQHLI